MPRAQPKRWPASVNTSQALGYLLARHVPLRTGTKGLKLVRDSAGWLPASGLQPADVGVIPATVNSWLNAARHHAAVLGPPPGMKKLLRLLSDGVIRDAATARSILVAAGAEDVADPQVLVDFAHWCGAEPALASIPVGRHRDPARAYASDARDLARARTAVGALARRHGLITVNRALAELEADGLACDTGGDAESMRELLGVAGYSGWFWPLRDDVSTPLTSAMERISALRRPVPVEQLPEAVARIVQKRPPRVAGEWPLPVDGVRAWVRARPDWRLTADDEAEPLAPGEFHLYDKFIQSALAGERMNWTALSQALKDAGMTSPTAGSAIYTSPILRRTPTGYALLGPRDPLPYAEVRPLVEVMSSR